MAPAKAASSAWLYPPIPGPSSRTGMSVLLPRHTPLSPLFSSLLCSTCSTLRLCLLRNGYAQTSIASRTEVLHSATVCRMCKLFLHALEVRFGWMKDCSSGQVDSDDGSRSGSDDGREVTRMDSCALLRPATAHIRAQAVFSGTGPEPRLADRDGDAVASAGGLGVKVVVFGHSDLDQLPEANLCVWHLSERRRRMATQPVSDLLNENDRNQGQPAMPLPKTPPAMTKKQSRSNSRISRNTVFHSARQWLLEVTHPPTGPAHHDRTAVGQPPISPAVKARLSTFLLDVTSPPEIQLVRTIDLIAAKGKLPRYAAFSHCINADPAGRYGGRALPEHQMAMPLLPARWSALPTFIQHAVLATRALKLRYLWVPEVCVPRAKTVFSKNQEADDPATVFSNAFVTLAVHAARADDGFLGRSCGGFGGSPTARLEFSDFLMSVEIQSALGAHPFGLLARLTSRNMIHFTPGRIYFEDPNGVRSPSHDNIRLRNLGPGLVAGLGRPDGPPVFLDRTFQKRSGMVPLFGAWSEPGQVVPVEWYDVLEAFSRCRQSAPTARLEAIDSVAAMVAAPDGRLVFGIWTRTGDLSELRQSSGVKAAVSLRVPTDLSRSLGWRPIGQPLRLLPRPPVSRSPPAPLPTWSWARADSEVEFADGMVLRHNQHKTLWLLGADSTKLEQIQMADVARTLRVGDYRPTPADQPVDSAGLLSSSSLCPGFDSTFSLALDVGLGFDRISSRLVMAGVVISVRLSSRLWGKSWLHVPQSGLVDSGPPLPPFVETKESEVEQFYDEPRYFPGHLHPPSRTVYRGIYSRSAPVGSHMLGWCALDFESGTENDDDLFSCSSECDGEYTPQVGVLLLAGGYGLLVKKVSGCRKRGSELVETAGSKVSTPNPTSPVIDQTEPKATNPPSPSRRSTSMYARLAAGKVGRSLSLARRKEEMERREKDESTPGPTTTASGPNSATVSARSSRRLSDFFTTATSTGRSTSNSSSPTFSIVGSNTTGLTNSGQDNGAVSFQTPGLGPNIKHFEWGDVPTYIRIGIVRLDDRLVDRSLLDPIQSNQPNRSSYQFDPKQPVGPRIGISEIESDIDRIIQDRSEMTSRMRRVGAKGCVIGLV